MGETLTVTVNGATYTVGDGKLSYSGNNWSLQIPAGKELAEGTYSVVASILDSAGNVSTDVTNNELVIDLTAPVIPTVNSLVTNDTTPLITGTASVLSGEIFKVTVNGVTYTLGDGKLTLTGTSWSLQIPSGSEILNGIYSVTATVTDVAGNVSTDTTSNELTIDTIAPVIPTVISQITNDTTPLIKGTATVITGEIFKVTVNGVTYISGEGKLTLTGTNWSLQIPAGKELVDGIYSVIATVTDVAGNASTDTTSNELTIDTVAPAVPTVNIQTTNDTTPIITGTAIVPLGETLTVTVNGVTYTVGDGKLTLTGTNWSLQVPTGSEINNGTYEVVATVKDAAGNSSTDTTTKELIIDTVAPLIPVVFSQVTNNTKPVIKGTATVSLGDVFTVSVSGVTYTSGDGKLTLTGTNWSLQIPAGSELVDGIYSVIAAVKDVAGNVSTDITSNELTIDTIPPVVPTVAAQMTNDTTPIITGTATLATGEVLKVTVNGVTYSVGDGKLTISGTSWSLQIPNGSELADGVYSVTATVTDVAGNSSTDTTNNELTIDNIAPAVPTVIAQITNDTTPLIKGTVTVASGEIFKVTVNGVTYTSGDGNLAVSGTSWSLQIPSGRELISATYSVTATLTDVAGNSSLDLTSNELIIDTIPPAIPTVVSQVTDDTTPLIRGTAVIGTGESLTVTVNGVTYTVGDGKLSLNGVNWSLQIADGNKLSEAVYQVVATVTDSAGNSSTDITTNELTVDTNKAPLAVDDTFATSGPAFSGNLATNDKDPEGGQLTYKITPVTAPKMGTVSILPNGSFTYTPNSSAIGSDTFVYEVCDNGFFPKCAQAKVTINFNNQSPLAVNDAYSADQGTVIGGRMYTNDNDLDGNALIYATTPISGPAHGAVVIRVDGTFDYTPDPTYVGNDSFTYRVCDDGIPSLCASAVVSFELTKKTEINRAPYAMNDINNTLQNAAVSGNVLTNDYDPEGDEFTLSTQLASSPSNGKVVISANGEYVYTPNANFVGEDYFSYRICEKKTSPALCSEGNVTIEVYSETPGNRAPIANEDEAIVVSGKTIVLNVLSNDFDSDSNPIHISRIPTGVSHGTLVQNSDGTFTYTSSPTFVGLDQFVYEICDDQNPSLCSRATVSIQVIARGNANNPPFAADDAFFTTGTSISGSLALNDSDPDGNTLIYAATPLVLPTKGTVTIFANGQFTYTPVEGIVNGFDHFIYQVCDNGNPSACSKATVYITLVPNNKPTLNNDWVTTSMGKSISRNLLSNDSDPDGDNLILNKTPISGPSNGTIVIDATGWYTYTPNAGFVGTDIITYEVCDDGKPSACAQETLTVSVGQASSIIFERLATNDVNITFKNKPISGNVLSNDAGFYDVVSTVNAYLLPVNGTLVMGNNGDYTYTPKKDFLGVDNFYYTVCTSEAPADCDTVNVTISVIEEFITQIPPVANDDEMQTRVNTVAKGNVLANDISASGEPLILNHTLVKKPEHGTVVMKDDGSFVYTPNDGFAGRDNFVYEICGKVSGICDNAIVTITIPNETNQMRIFAADDLYFSYGNTVLGNLLNNDLYVIVVNNSDNTLKTNESQNTGTTSTSTLKSKMIVSSVTDNGSGTKTTLRVSMSLVTPPSHGKVSANNKGVFKYTPVVGFVGTDQFIYEICDDQLNVCDRATVYVVVKDLPTVFADLVIEKTGSATAIPGGTVDYQIKVTNLGTSKSNVIRISDYVPKSIENPTYKLAGSLLSTSWTGYYDLAGLDANKEFSLYISGKVSANAPDTLKNEATVSSQTYDPKMSNNISTVNTVISRGPIARIQNRPYMIVGDCNVKGKVLDASKSSGDNLSFSWSPSIYLDNATSAKPVCIAKKTTKYKLTVTDSWNRTDTTSILMVVAVPPKAVVAKNVFVEAPNTSILLDGSKSIGAGLSYLWTSKEGVILNGKTTPTSQVSGLGMYYLQVTDSLGCMNRDSVNVGLYIQAVNDTVKTNVNESIYINVVRNDSPAKAINPASISIVTPPLHGIAQVAADSLIMYLPEDSYIGSDEFVYAICDYFKNCDNAKVLVLINDIPLFVPEAFSPNGDGINDKFEIKGLSKYKTVELEIFNRWGNVVYRSKNYGEGPGKSGYWDGTAQAGMRIGSGPVPTGTYFYILKLNGKENINGSIYIDR